jgi:hypothetical protein
VAAIITVGGILIGMKLKYRRLIRRAVDSEGG